MTQDPIGRQDAPVAWVTGAAGGLGRGLVRAFRAAGWRVAASGHTAKPGEPAGEDCLELQTEVRDPGSVAAAVGSILQRWARLDVLINNAGCLRDRALAQLSDADWDEVLDVNLGGAFRCARAVLPGMMAARRGHIIQVTSLAAREGVRGQANYSAAKAGLVGLTLSLAREAGPYGICVNAVMPGMLRTSMIAALEDAQVGAQESRSVLGRLNTVEEAARFVVTLAALNHVSGQVFNVDARLGRWT